MTADRILDHPKPEPFTLFEPPPEPSDAAPAPALPPIEYDPETGVFFDPETGEVFEPETLIACGPAFLDYASRLGLLSIPCFDLPDMEAALENLAEIESNLEKILSRRDAIVANMNRQANQVRRQAQWWEWRNRGPVVAFAKAHLSAKKKTWQGDYGSVAFRSSAGTNAIIDDDAAKVWLERWAPERIKWIAKFTVSDILAAIPDAQAAMELDEVRLPFLASSGPKENVTIKTGVGDNKEAKRGK